MVKGGRYRANKLENDGLGSGLDGISAFREKSSDGKYGIELGSGNARRIGEKGIGRRATTANPCNLLEESRGVLRNQIAELEQCFHGEQKFRRLEEERTERIKLNSSVASSCSSL